MQQVGALAAGDAELLLGLRSQAGVQHPLVREPARGGLLGAEQLVVGAAHGAARRQPEHELQLAVRDQVAVLGVLGVDHERRVVDDRLELQVLRGHRALDAALLGHVAAACRWRRSRRLRVAQGRAVDAQHDRCAVLAQHLRLVAWVDLALRDRRGGLEVPLRLSGDWKSVKGRPIISSGSYP